MKLIHALEGKVLDITQLLCVEGEGGRAKVGEGVGTERERERGRERAAKLCQYGICIHSLSDVLLSNVVERCGMTMGFLANVHILSLSLSLSLSLPFLPSSLTHPLTHSLTHSTTQTQTLSSHNNLMKWKI